MKLEYRQPFEWSGSRAQLITGAALVLIIALFWPGVVIGICGVVSLLIHLKRVSSRWGDSRPFKIFASGIAIRFFFLTILAVISAFKGEPITLFGDSRLSFLGADFAIQTYYGTWDLFNKESYILPGLYGYTILHWINGALYLIAGYSPFLLKLVSVVASCLAAWIVYLISFRVTANRTVSAWVMGLCTFWPSNILWSVDLLKEPAIQLYTAVIIYLFVDMIVRKKWQNLIILGLIWYPIGHFRDNYQWIMLATLLISSLLFIPRRLVVGVFIIFALVIAGFIKMGPTDIKNRFENFQQRVIGAQQGFITTGGSYYVFLPDRFLPGRSRGSPMTVKEMVTSYLKAVYYYLGTPKPYARLTLSKLPALPQMIIWYLMLILFLPAGVLYLLQYRWREAGVVLVFLVVATSAVALFTANEGTAFRHRDILTPFYFIPITVGMLNIRGWLAEKYRRLRSAPVPVTGEKDNQLYS
ncbi:MAG TPA: hypothetical protein ENI06_07415 [Spirochaetales bacterium]|nr:hypothetical protein [Spirochaetales bacterium]